MLDLHLHPSTKQLRQFGFILAVLGFGFSLWCGWQRHLFGYSLGQNTGAWVGTGLAIASLSLLVAWLRPSALLFPYRGLSLLTFPIGVLLSYTVLALLYFGLFTPMGWIMRLLGKDPLQRKRLPEKSSYWMPHIPTKDPNRYTRQF
ncbi:MAG: hypothetical protein DWQ01_08915 [Planctomycetota bacterium]|nr:MAG: hypothetical protein DWQ01_08915 [Planctomycetota bacterium]